MSSQIAREQRRIAARLVDILGDPDGERKLADFVIELQGAATGQSYPSSSAPGFPVANRPAKPPRWETVPAGTRESTCNGHLRGGECRAAIYWIERPRAGGKPGTARIPVDCDVPGGSAPDSMSPGQGVSHFGTCPDAESF